MMEGQLISARTQYYALVLTTMKLQHFRCYQSRG